MRDYTDVTIVLDRSQSMQRIKEGTIEGINSFIQEQKMVPGDGCWTLVDFDDPKHARERGEVFPRTVLAQVPQAQIIGISAETYQPRGNTALIDALCITIDSTGKRLAGTPESIRPNRVLFVVMTDGEENHSASFTPMQLRQRITHQQDAYNWKFIFLGANQDAFAVAESYGIPRHHANTYAYSNKGAVVANQLTSGALRAWKVEGNNTAKDFIIEPTPPEDAVTPGANP